MPDAYIGLVKALAHHPVGWLALAGLVGWVGRRGKGTMRSLPWLLTGLSIVVLIYGLVYSAAYLLYPTFTDHVEATIASNSAYLMQGRQLYHSPASEEWYSIIYGPWLFLTVEGAFRAFGPTILSSKIPGIACFVLALVGFSLVGYRRWGWQQACLATGLLSAGLVIFARLTISNRGDSYLILASVIGLSLLRVPQRHLAMLVMGAMAGVAAGVKLHAFAYLLPAVAVIAAGLGRHWWQGWLMFSSMAALVFWLPFLSPAISWNHLTEHIRLSTRHGLDWSSLELGLEFIVLFVLAAVAASTLRVRTRYQVHPASFPDEIVWLLAINVMVAVLALYPASKEGGGLHHLVPLLPNFLYGLFAIARHSSVSDLNGRVDQLLTGVLNWFVTIWLVVGALYWHRGLESLERTWSDAKEAQEEVEQLMQNLPPGSNVKMAFSDANSYWLTWFRPILVLRSHPIGVDPVAAMDLRKAGYPFPIAFLQCSAPENGTTAWLLPKTGSPFSMENYYLPHDRILDSSMSVTFALTAETTVATKHFTLWRCR